LNKFRYLIKIESLGMLKIKQIDLPELKVDNFLKDILKE